MRRITRRGRVGLVLAGVMAATLSPGLVASADAAAKLQCGQVYLDRHGLTGRSATMTHSCVGSGTVQYSVKCVGRDSQFSYYYAAPGKSILREISCGGFIERVEWVIK